MKPDDIGAILFLIGLVIILGLVGWSYGLIPTLWVFAILCIFFGVTNTMKD